MRRPRAYPSIIVRNTQPSVTSSGGVTQISRQRQDRIAVELLHQPIEIGDTAGDVLDRIETVGHAEPGGGGRDQLHQTLRPRAAFGPQVAPRFHRHHRQHQGR